MKNIKVLMIEDDEDDIVLIKKQLKLSKLFLDLEIVHTAEKGLEYLEKMMRIDSLKSTPFLILLDLNLPKMSGLEFLKIIKTDEKMKKIPVIMLTTSDLHNDIHQAYQYGVNSYITKPGDIAQYMRMIELLDGFWFTVVKLP